MIRLDFVFELVDLSHFVIEGFLKGKHLTEETVLELLETLAESIFQFLADFEILVDVVLLRQIWNLG